MQFPKIPAHIGVSLAFFGGIAAMLLLQTLQDPQFIIVPPAGSVSNQGEVQTCKGNDDCSSRTAICNEYRLCEELSAPDCTCSQPLVMQCADADQRAKHTFCPNGCSMTDEGVRCL